MSFSQLLHFLLKGENVLTKPTEWNDKCENAFQDLLSYKNDFKKKFRSSIDAESLNLIYGQSWNKSVESDAMWTIYSPDAKGVMVKVKLENLIKSEELDLNIGKVGYFDRNAFISEVSDLYESKKRQKNALFYSMLVKRSAFSHEKEYRLMFMNDKDAGNYLSYKFDWFNALEEILFDPRCKRHEFEAMKATLQKSFKNLKCTIRQSSIYGACGNRH